MKKPEVIRDSNGKITKVIVGPGSNGERILNYLHERHKKLQEKVNKKAEEMIKSHKK